MPEICLSVTVSDFYVLLSIFEIFDFKSLDALMFDFDLVAVATV